MAIGVPYTLGGSAAAAGANSSTFTSSTATTTGDALIVALGSSDVTVTPTGTTVGTPSLTLAQVSSQLANTQSSWLYVLENATALTTSSVITTAWSGTTQVKNMQGIACSGLATTSATDTAAIGKGSGSGVTASAATTSLASANSLVVAVCESGYLTVSHTWGAGWTQIGSTRRATGGSYLSVATQVVSSTTPVTATCTLGATGLWSMQVVPLKGASAGGVSIITTTLASGTVGVPYADIIVASAGSPPFLFDLTVGSVPAGLTLNPGQPGGGSDPITHVAANGGPDGTPGQALSDWTNAYSTIGPLTGIKTFISGDLPATFIGTLADQARQAHPACVPIICWNGPPAVNGIPQPSSPATITRFCSTIPAGVSVGFGWQQEPENPTSGLSAAQFVSGFSSIARVIHNLGRPELFTITSSTWGQYGTTGRGVGGGFLPPAVDVDVYGFDLYQHQAGGSLNGVTSWPANGISTAGCHFQRWLALVKPLATPLGRQLALTEYGIDDNGTLAARNARLQQDYTYIKTAFNGGSASPYPLFMFLYWWHNMADLVKTQYKFTDTATVNTWKGIAAGSSSGGGGSTGGQITGTPTTAGTSNFTARATDALGATATHAETIIISASSTLVINTTTLTGGTLNGFYSAQLLASGGTTPYTWAVTVGSLPTGLTLDTAAGVISGTPTVAGSYSFTVRVTDNVAATASQALVIIVAGGLNIVTTSLPTGQVGAVYTTTLAVGGGTAPYSWGLDPGSGPLPAGLILDPDAGTISGTPTMAGAFPLTLQVTDAGGAGASDTQPVTLTVAAAGGGLPPIGRRRFGQTTGAWIGRFVGDAWDRAPAATVVFFDALVNGNQYVDLQTTGGAPIDHTTADANGAWGEIYGPDGVMRMAIDANGGNGPRAWVDANDLPDLIKAIYTALKTLTG